MPTDRNHHVHRIAIMRSQEGVFSEQSKVSGVDVFYDFTRDPANEGDTFAASPLKEILEALSKRPDIYVKNENLGVRPVLFDEKSIFNGIHAANIAAVWVATLASRAYTLEKGHFLGPLTIGGPDQFAG